VEVLHYEVRVVL